MWNAYRDLYQELSSVLEDQLLRDAGLPGSEYAVLVVDRLRVNLAHHGGSDR
jgi:hypothetical protein